MSSRSDPIQASAVSTSWLQVVLGTTGTDDRETLSELLGSCSQLDLNDNSTESQIQFFSLARYIPNVTCGHVIRKRCYRRYQHLESSAGQHRSKRQCTVSMGLMFWEVSMGRNVIGE